jgi:DNA-binding beta-propeller fold protein YncE
MAQALVSDARRTQLLLVELGVTQPSFEWVGDPGDFAAPWGLSASAAGGSWAVADTANHRVVIFADPSRPLDNATTLGGQGSGDGELERPAGVTLAPDGTVLIADTGNRRIVQTEPGGAGWSAYGSSTGDPTAPGHFREPYAVAVDADGRLWVADRLLGRVVRMDDMDGNGWTVLPAGAPASVTAVQDRVFVSDIGRHELVARDAASTDVVARVALPGPAAVTSDGSSLLALDAASGRVLIFDIDLNPSGETVYLKDLGVVAPRGLCLT